MEISPNILHFNLSPVILFIVVLAVRALYRRCFVRTPNVPSTSYHPTTVPDSPKLLGRRSYTPAASDKSSIVADSPSYPPSYPSYTFSADKALYGPTTSILRYSSPSPMARELEIPPTILRDFRECYPSSLKGDSEYFSLLQPSPHHAYTPFEAMNSGYSHSAFRPTYSTPCPPAAHTSPNPVASLHRVLSNDQTTFPGPPTSVNASLPAVPPQSAQRLEPNTVGIVHPSSSAQMAPPTTLRRRASTRRMDTEARATPTPSVSSDRRLTRGASVLSQTSVAPEDVARDIESMGWHRYTKKPDTAYFVSSSKTKIQRPPAELSSHPKLQVGDIFYHKHDNGYQLWIWQMDQGYVRWQQVALGYQRADGLCLALTERQKKPSWVSRGWQEKLAKKTM